MKKQLLALAAASALTLASLAGCKSQATFTQVLGDAKVELTELNGTTEGDFDLPYSNGHVEVELESGTIDVEIVDIAIFHDSDDDEEVVEYGTIITGEGLVSGDSFDYVDEDGAIRVRITSSDNAVGTLTFSAA